MQMPVSCAVVVVGTADPVGRIAERRNRLGCRRVVGFVGCFEPLHNDRHVSGGEVVQQVRNSAEMSL